MAADLNDSCQLQQHKVDGIDLATKIVHAGQCLGQLSFGDVVPPISLTTTFKQFAPNEHAVRFVLF